MRKLTHEEISKHRYSPDELKTIPRLPIYVLLDNIRSLYNVGSVFRTSDGARIEKLFLTGYTPFPPRKEIEKTALGATNTVPWEYHKDPIETIHPLKSQGIRVCTLEHTDKSIPYYSLTKEHFPLCLIVGNEITGVRKEIIAETDFSVDIPMFGMKQSLNAAVAYGIAVFEFVKILRSE
ncbi:MAG: RNA methyltransferase [Ignavibacteriales bacterium]|nr:RNA methyltransferase [Ignavibacteriales bacterium]